MLLRWHMCMSHRRCFSTRQSGFFVAPLLDNGNQDFNVSVANDVEIGLTSLHIETSTWQVMNPHPRTGQRPGFCGTTWFCPRQMEKWLKWITGHRWFLQLRGAHLSSMRPGRLEMMLVKSKTQISVSTLLRHSLPFFIIFCWENNWNTRTGERSIVQPEVLDNQYKIRSDASQPIVVRWSKDSDVVGWMNEWMILHVSFCSFSRFTKTVLNCHAILGRSWRFQKRRTASHWILPIFMILIPLAEGWSPWCSYHQTM